MILSHIRVRNLHRFKPCRTALPPLARETASMTGESYHLLPGICVLCHRNTRRSMDICRDCETDLPWIANPCLYCGLPLPTHLDVCSKCRGKPQSFSTIIAPFVYQFPIDALIQGFKNNRQLAIGHVLATLLTNHLLRAHSSLILPAVTEKTIVVPVPLHWLRKRHRGFNQSLLIANQIGAISGLPVREPVRRIRSTPEQKSRSLGQRKQNLIQAFETSDNLLGTRIVLVDDVVTTMATVSEISKVLFAAGADDVVVTALARTPNQRLGSQL